MKPATIHQPGSVLGVYDPEEGALGSCMAECSPLGILLDTHGKVDSIVFPDPKGEDWVLILTLDTGYGQPVLSLHTSEVLEELKTRIQQL